MIDIEDVKIRGILRAFEIEMLNMCIQIKGCVETITQSFVNSPKDVEVKVEDSLFIVDENMKNIRRLVDCAELLKNEWVSTLKVKK